ncbi:glycosyltransferase family 2 protein [Paenibacillus alvei]|uniref:glycosyltransferase family 2 protein n=1 Tax=Paenibacillus alvei TaxID=44250 RepID=UPI0003866649|nr:glycosyltransferase family 2 protein [Paenibacillus alvei]EPY13411.1 family 2 glycosyl transferase [Paenibacillus alvei A6-6i-x]
MRSEKLVSIIVPNYNNAKYIEYCIRSLLAQSYSNMEIIIADDASTDGSQEVIEMLVGMYSNVRAIYNRQNIGITRNRKRAILQANGEYVNYLDSDDFIQNPYKLEAEMELIQYYLEKYNEDVIAFSDVAIADGEGNFVNRFRDMKPVREGYIAADLLTRRCLIPQNFTFHKRVYESIGGHDEAIPFYENWDLKIRLGIHKYVFTGESGFVYRRHGEGLSNASLSHHQKWVRYIAQKNLPAFPKEEQSLLQGRIDEMVLHIEDELRFINSHLQQQV